jgi:hypothetical protein
VIVEIHQGSTIHMSKLTAELSSVTTVSVDLAKHVFQVHAVDAGGKVIVARALRRRDLLPFSRPCRRASSGWRRADRRIIGDAS